MAFIIRDNELSDDVRKLIYRKQHEFKAEKKRSVSLGKTFDRLLKEAYLNNPLPNPSHTVSQ